MWVTKEASGEAKVFPLVEGGCKLPVRFIARFWKLDPATLCIGQDHVLISDETSGNSVQDAESVRKTARELGLGDGSSREAALPITGKRAAGGSDPVAKKRKGRKEQELARVTKLFEEEDRLLEEEQRKLYGTGGMYEYAARIQGKTFTMPAEIVLDAIRTEFSNLPLIGWLHSVKPGELLGLHNRRGMVTLMQPNGTCLTSKSGMGTLEETYVVCIGNKSYHCTGRISGHFGILEPLPDQRQSFSACVPVTAVAAALSPAFLACWDEEKGEVRVVDGLNMGFSGRSGHNVMMPCEKLEIPQGAPVIDVCGHLSGIVVMLTKPDSRTMKTNGGCLTTQGDLDSAIVHSPPSIARRLRQCKEVDIRVYYHNAQGILGPPLEEEWNLSMEPFGSRINILDNDE